MGALAKLASSAGGPGPTCIAARRSKAHAEAELKNLGGMRDASCPVSSIVCLLPARRAARRPAGAWGKKTGGTGGQRGARTCRRLRSSKSHHLSRSHVASRACPPLSQRRRRASSPSRGRGRSRGKVQAVGSLLFSERGIRKTHLCMLTDLRT